MRTNFLGLNPLPEGCYVCRSCGRDVDAELEVSPGEPETCLDCFEWEVCS